MILKKLKIFFLLTALLTGSQIQAIEAVKISNQATVFHLAKNSKFIEDSEHQLTLESFLELEDSAFQKPKSDVPYLDFTSSSYWMKLSVENDGNTSKFYYIEAARPLTNLIKLYLLDENNELIKVWETGDDLPFLERPYPYRKFVFPINFPANSTRKLVLQTKSDGEILKLPMKFYTINGFTEFVAKENFFTGLYYGFLSLVFILFSFFGFALRQRLYSIFVLYVFFFGLFQFALDGFAYQYFWPNNPWMGNHAILIFAGTSILALLIYADVILEFYKIKGLYYQLYKVFYTIAGIGLIGSFTGGQVYAITFPLLNGLSLFMAFYFFIGIYLKFKTDKKPGFALTAAFIFLWLGALTFVASNINLISNEFLANNALKIGSAIEITFLSLAMAGRYRENQKEKISAQEIAYARLEEVNALKIKQTEELESQVKERTKEISDKNLILSQQNKEIINSINYAKRLQNAILPSKVLFENCFKEYGLLYLPKDIVSGDFYWLEKTKTHVFFAVADCTGHGVPGALVSVVGYNALNRCINELKLTNPAEILDQMTIFVEETFSKNQNTVSDGMDMSICSWDYKDKVEFSGAFNPIYLIRNEELIEIKGNKQPIGKFIKREPFTKHEINLIKGDSLYLFSDGYPDQFGGERGKKLKYSEFKNYLLEFNKQPANTMETFLKKRFDEWKNVEEQIDDVCIMNIRF
tara:strand:+ start:10638 stop:12725 length:2088 start_codon:yes stop_codon:yes gene_type:complete